MSIVVNKTRLPVTEWKTEKASVVSVNDARMRAAKEIVVDINPVQEGSGDPSPTNIRPIHGWTGCKTYDDPRYGGLIRWNQLFYNAEDWTPQQTQTAVSIDDGVIVATLVSGSPSVYAPGIPVPGGTAVTTIAGHKYYMAIKLKPATNGYPYFRNNTAFTTEIPWGTKITQAGEWGDYKAIVSAGANGGPAWYIGQSGETSSIQIGDSISIKDLVCIDLTEAFGAGNEPSTVEQVCSLFPKDSYPYDTSGNEKTVSEVNGEPHREITVTFPSSVGTVYGGTVDVTEGKLVIDRKYVKVGSSGWNYYSPYIYRTYDDKAKPTIASSEYPLMCSSLPYDGVKYASQFSNVCIAQSANKNVYIKDTSCASSSDYYTKYSDAEIVYYLATPVEVTMTPQELEMFLRENNIWSDTGET